MGDAVSAADKLREARKLIERGWCQHHYAEDAAGNIAEVGDDAAVAWCAAGALWKAGTGIYEVGLMKRAIGGCATDAWNDAPGRTQAEVLAAFDRAIALAEAGE